MTNRGFPVLLLCIGFGALLVIGRLHMSALDHKLMLILWTVIFYSIVAVHKQDRRIGELSTIAYRTVHLQPQSRTEELFDADRIAMQNDGHEWNPTVQAGDSDDILMK